MAAKPFDPTLAKDTRKCIRSLGGLVTQADIARRWGITPPRTHELSQIAGFPKPVVESGRTALWFAKEVDAWRKERQAANSRRGHSSS